ncbi:MAG: hypothetical protein IKA63_06340 [Clostridia bacterium]|nr:hypothetical protein [Clostridia bacterium]
MTENDPILDIDEILSEDAVVAMPPLYTEVETETEPAAENAPTPKKKRGFLIGLGVYFSILLILIGVAMWFLNGFLVDYEATIPSFALDQYVQWVQDKDYESIYDHAEFEETTLVTKDEYIAYLERIYAGTPNEITLRQRVSAQENIQEYSVYYDDKRMSIIYLSSREEEGKTRWQVTTKLVYQPELTLICGTDNQLLLNGEDISLLGFTPEEIQETVFSGAKDAAVYPTVYRYTLSGFLNEPRIEATSLNGSSCEVVRDENDPTLFRLKHPISAENKLQLEELATTAATTYAKFIAKDETRKNFLKLVYKDCAFYDTIRNFNNEWFNDHDSYEFKDLKVLNGFQYSDSDYTCEVTFRPVYTRKGKEIDARNAHYRVHFLRIDDQWLLTSLSIVADAGTTTDSDAATQTTTNQ